MRPQHTGDYPIRFETAGVAFGILVSIATAGQKQNIFQRTELRPNRPLKEDLFRIFLEFWPRQNLFVLWKNVGINFFEKLVFAEYNLANLYTVPGLQFWETIVIIDRSMRLLFTKLSIIHWNINDK